MMTTPHYETESMRLKIRNEGYDQPTAGLCGGYAQGNLVILPKSLAYDFLLFAQRNPVACPLLEVSDLGDPRFPKSAPSANILTDLPKYRVYKSGVCTGIYTDIKRFWREDFVAFLIGCSFTFEAALLEAGIPMKHIESGSNVAMYQTNIACEKAGIFEGPVVVSMRPIKRHQLIDVVRITSEYPSVHGAPIHIGDPSQIGIEDIMKPDFGDAVPIEAGEEPVFWACGVTPQAVAMAVKPALMITHEPGHMFITDIPNRMLRR